ncbi:bifunctional riboflavin kinase/FMN adenylyltransferase [Firmicutes bacterium CAG:240]|jgi:riboflavin kinase/FMN adenylyltransferase|nr:bifunctional riboflavin kinase/FAD synthetase [Oscillospiraceae bacterium]OLA43324.1 MAG: riboflavin biosynthesis protein RibF [Firmicutes bacterium CAG:24053_14]CDB43760.1 bifunctional riboflavin kinase/FMN adenylyltransferase [Firmicutes bacterium CAG:240]
MTKQKVMALGFFDGIHVGHAALINKIKQRAEETGAEPAVLTFDVHPDNLVFKKTVPLINSAEDRENILSRCFGIDDVVVIHFNQRVMHMDWQDFIDELIDEMNLRWIVVGHDFCFGYKGLGTAEKLKAYCAERGVGCDIIPAVCRDGVVVSSTLIRQLIETGEMEKANEYLGHPHTLTDVIRTGYHLGTKMGTPTINMSFPQGVIIPRHGVYAAKAYIDGQEYMSVTNVGIRPTVSDSGNVNVESFLLDFCGNLYGHRARIDFYKFLRPERKFDDVNELAAQIKSDAQTTREYFERIK